MANRVGYGVGRGMSRIGGALQEIGADTLRRRDMQNQILLRELVEKVATGEMEPEEAELAMEGRRARIPKGYFSALMPSADTQLAGLTDSITSAKTHQEVPTETALGVQAGRMLRRTPFKPIAYGAPTGGGDTGMLPSRPIQPLSPEWETLKKVRAEKMESFPPTKYDEVLPTGEKKVGYVSSNPASLTGRSWTTELPAVRQGELAGEKTVAQTRTENAQGLPGLKGQAKLQEDLAGVLSPEYAQGEVRKQNTIEAGTRGERVKTASATASASTIARLNAEFRPEFVNARLQESARQAIQSAEIRNDMEAKQQAVAQANAAGQLQPFFTELIRISSEMNNLEWGPAARTKGAVQSAANIVGLSRVVGDFNALTARYVRPLAVAFGAREANVSDRDIEIVREAIGIRPGLTWDERFDRLRDLRTRVMVGPFLAARMPPNATLGDRFTAAGILAKKTMEAEDEARRQGKLRFVDPVTGGTYDVIPY